MENASYSFGFEWQAQDIFLPLGISFFTFQQLSWLIDSYKGLVKPSDSSVFEQFLEYTLFVSFFPQLIAGPIVHHGQIIPQFKNAGTFVMNWRSIALGLSFFSLGLFKKVVIADTLSPWVADGFDNTDTLTFIEAWGAALCYTFQIYFDFSGYSDMAIGLGKLFNIDIPMNFNSPYKSTSIIDFWRRWHMTLSQFLRDYIYIPLGGNRFGETRRYINLFLTMLIGGLWHGAAWQFVFWGFLHGIYLCGNHLWRKLNIAIPKVIGWFFTFTLVVFAWVFFRAASFGRAWEIVKGMCGANGVFIPENYLPIHSIKTMMQNIGINIGAVLETWHFHGMLEARWIVSLLLIVLMLRNSVEWTENKLREKFRMPLINGIYFIFLISLFLSFAMLYIERASEFLYFQF